MLSLLLGGPELGHEFLHCLDDHHLVSIDLDKGFRLRTPLACPHASIGSFSIDMVVVPGFPAIVLETSLAESKLVATVAIEIQVDGSQQHWLTFGAYSAGIYFWTDLYVDTTCSGLKK